MVSTLRALSIAALAMLALSCGDDDRDTDHCNPKLHRATFSRCMSARDQSACETAGGTWRRDGLFQDLHCFCPTGQSDCPCSTTSQCLGDCVGPAPWDFEACPAVQVGTCAPTAPYFGCRCTLFSDGEFGDLCTD